MEDVREKESERQAQEEMKRRTGGGLASFLYDSDDDGVTQKDMQTAFYNYHTTLLWHTLLDIKELANDSRRRNSSPMLPLLSTDENEPEEIVLGAALALSDQLLVDRAIKQCRQAPGLGLTTLSHKSLDLIQTVFQKCMPRPLHISLKDMQALVVMATHNDSARQGQPALMVLPSQDRKNSDLLIIAKALGLHVFCQEDFRPEAVDFGGSGHWLHFRLVSQQRKFDKKSLYLTNFDDSFLVPVTKSSGGKVHYQFTDIKLESTVARVPDALKTMEYLFLYIGYNTMQEAASRLKQLQKGSNRQGVSLALISAFCGYDGDIFIDMVQTEKAMIEHYLPRFSAILALELSKCIPCPLNPLDESTNTPSVALREEIDAFLINYMHLLQFSYCDIPRNRGRPPSALVPRLRVSDKASEGFMESTPFAERRIRRILERDERLRYVQNTHVTSRIAPHSCQLMKNVAHSCAVSLDPENW
jgi:hypothetical protein